MSKVETKADLLKFMATHRACGRATKWVKSRKEKTFLEIWNACPRIDWLDWMLQRQDYDLAEEWWRYVIQKAPRVVSVEHGSSENMWRLLDEARLALLKRAYRG